MAIPNAILSLYKGLSPKELFYIRVRWMMSPIAPIEKMAPGDGMIYDIGCGAGLLSNLLAVNSKKRDVVGIDLSEEKIGIAKKSLDARGNIRFERGDALQMNFGPAHTIVTCDILHHLSFLEQKIFLKRAYDFLYKDGLMLIQDIDKKPFLKYFFALTVDKIFNRMAKTYYRSSQDMYGLLTEAGFKVEMKRVYGYPISAVIFKCTKI